ncbi:hypothetical protein [Methylocystis sp. Sn-Cys]|uniref:hypothetical protein n=1 Tax=Methylocystis sp. Sn-Cys TaxID=1701263 RepID=UPI0019206994|nr:hypothetical protein [Methylocystis sp. Sn-Cys]MBL1258004.1 hypothetical protein [Methylocystis sp. Sn-Cys]
MGKSFNRPRAKTPDNTQLAKALRLLELPTPVVPLDAARPNEPLPRLEDDPCAYARLSAEYDELKAFVKRRLAAIADGRARLRARPSDCGSLCLPFFEPFFKARQKKQNFVATGPAKRKQAGNVTRRRIIEEWEKASGRPSRDRASLVAKRLEVSPRHVRRVIREEIEKRTNSLE